MFSVSGSLTIPDFPAPPTGRGIVAWAHPTTGVVEKCAPTLLPDPLGSGAMPAQQAVIDNGYVMQHPDDPRLKLSAAPAQVDDGIPSVRPPGPRKGEHTRDVLAEVGYGGDEIESLVAAGVVIAS